MSQGKNAPDNVSQIMLETARVQVAALNAGIVFWSGWLEGTTKFTQAVNEELMKVGTKSSDAGETAGKIADSSREYLRKMTELPNAAVSRFNQEIAKNVARKAKPHRAARAKE